MEKKRKILEVESDDSQAPKIKKKKQKDIEKKDKMDTNNQDSNLSVVEEKEARIKKKEKIQKDLILNENEYTTNKNSSEVLDSELKAKTPKKRKRHKNLNENEDMIDSEQSAEENGSKKNQNIERKKKEKPGNEICLNGNKEGVNIVEKTSETIEPSGIDQDGINTPTTKKPPRKSGETKKQYKRRIRALREAGLLIDPPVVGAKKDKRNKNKSRKEKKMAKEQKNEELEKFRSIVQVNYLKMWKSDPSKWKFNKNVQGKIIKHMFDASRIPQDIFEVLIEYVTGPKTSTKMHDDINKKCSQVVEAMEKWTSANEEEKKKLTEPDQQVYERARKMLQSLA